MKTSRLFAAAVAAFLATAGLAPADGREGSKQLAVVSATPDLVNENLTLAGVNFGASSGIVTLDGLPLALISWSDTQVVVKLPSDVIATPGSYLTTVARPRPGRRSNDDDDDDGEGNRKRTGVFIVTVGAVGLQGEKGDMGPEGDAGPEGPAGDKGDTGAQGIQGLKGDKGETGAQGPKGDAGVGSQGPPGPEGPQGPAGVVPGASTVGPAIFAATGDICGHATGQLTTSSSCTSNACQDRPTDDQSTSTCAAGTTTSTFASSNAVPHFGGCPAGKIDYSPAISPPCCSAGPFGVPVNCVGRVVTHTTYNVCFSCLVGFTELGKLVK